MLIYKVIGGHRHRNYKRTLEVRDFSYRMVTGEDQRDYVVRYKPSEKMVLKKQRFALYNSPTKYVLARPRKYFKKFASVQGINITIEGDSNRISEINAAVENFENRSSLINWLVSNLEYYGSVDPNAWIFYDRHDTRRPDNSIEKTKILPIVIPSVDVLDFMYVGDTLMYFVFRESRIETDAKGIDRVYENFYTIERGLITRAIEASPAETAENNQGATLETLMYNKLEKKNYFVSIVENGSLEVAAMCCGAYKDEKTNRKTFVSWFDPAEHVLFDLIRDKSLLDVNKVVSAFAKRYEYTKACTFEDSKKGRCQGGFYGGLHTDENRCLSCGGSGKVANHTTEQEVLQLTMPRNTSELFELNKLYHNEAIDIQFPEYLERAIQSASDRIIEAVVNSGIIEKATGAATATEANYDYEDIYDMLLPYEKLVEAHFELVVRLLGQYMDIPLQKVDFRFPKDKKMKSLSTLLVDLAAAKASGAGYDVIRNIQLSIIEKQGEDNPLEVARIIARYDWLPFSDKTPEQTTMILATRSVLDFDRVLYENWTTIFNEIENENRVIEFHQLTYDKQKAKVSEKVEQIKAKITIAGNEQAQEAPAG